jgi:uncharacterized protein (TIGR03437 family)
VVISRACSVAALLLLPSLLTAQDRITAPLDVRRTVILKGHVHPKAQVQNDMGAVDPSMEISYATVLLKPSASLEAFLAEQQNRSSAEYHRWLTPEQFADRFGLTSNDIAKVVSWLESSGLHVNNVARGRHWITFSGKAAQAQQALHTEIHRYRVDGKTHFANATEPSIPAALEGVVSGFDGLDDFGLQPMNIEASASPDFTTGGTHYLAPDDIAAIYGIAPLYAAGFDGTGQKLVVIGQTAINIADIRTFRRRFNLPANDPQLVLVGPDPGIRSTDLPEADLDIEWSGSVARNATIIYVYSRNVNTSAQYAVDQNLAPVMSMSYGTCELSTTPALRAIAQQANAQGITWAVSSGDSGAATCDRNTPTPQASKGQTVSFPASIPEITAVGGTEFDEGNGAYCAAVNSANGASALSYIPEKAWNDSPQRNGLHATGGGASTFFPKPFWQTGPGVPDDKARDLPDVSFSASADHDGYEVTTSGATHIYGGTSVGTPVFAGMVTLLNHYLTSKGSEPGLGNINPTLYRLAQTTPDIFHDTATGDNMVRCAQGTQDCVDGYLGFSTGPGYDLATGLGSVDAYRLVTEWTNGASSSTALTANPKAFSITDTVQLTAVVTAAGSKPTGAVTFLTNDISLGSAPVDPASGTAVLAVNGTLIAAGNGTVTALYSGDGFFSGSAGSTELTLNLPAAGSLVIPSVTPNPVYQSGTGWPYTVTLTEKAGTATTLTGFTIDGATQNLIFFTSTNLPANGKITGSFSATGLTTPLNRVLRFTGRDAGGQTWSAQITVAFVASPGPVLTPTMIVTSTPVTVQQNGQGDPACQWSHNLVLQEQSGYLMQITKFLSGAGDLTDSILQLFGTTRLAPFGMLQATICRNDVGSSKLGTYQLTGISELGSAMIASASVTFAVAAATPAKFSASPEAITIPVADSSQGGTATVALNFAAGTPQWTVAILPANRTTKWLTVSASSGGGSAQLQVQASAAGLSRGVYSAILAIQSVNTVPQFINVPVTLVVGASSATVVNGVANAASFGLAFVPGMVMSVFGSGLAPTTQETSELPLPLALSGVSATVNGIAAPLYYASPGQLNIQVPYETGSGTATLGINNNGQVASYAFPVSAAAPGIFVGQGSALVPFSTGRRGEILLAFVTGEGDVTPSLATGATPPAGTSIGGLPVPRQPLILSVCGKQAEVAFAGIPTGLVGVTQINFAIPSDCPLGVQPVTVQVGGVTSAVANLIVTQ